jgi:hypothetical protein
MEPIKLTRYEETLLEYPKEQWQKSRTDEDTFQIGSVLGVHDVCRGWVDLRAASKTFNAITCRLCYLRVIIPNTIKTYGALREHLGLKEFVEAARR